MLGQKPNYMSCFVLEIGPWATIIIIIIFNHFDEKKITRAWAHDEFFLSCTKILICHF